MSQGLDNVFIKYFSLYLDTRYGNRATDIQTIRIHNEASEQLCLLRIMQEPNCQTEWSKKCYLLDLKLRTSCTQAFLPDLSTC